MRKLIVVIALVLTVVPVAAQKWTPPRTPWGDPDLQGLWPSWQLLSVPLERPVEPCVNRQLECGRSHCRPGAARRPFSSRAPDRDCRPAGFL